MGSERSGQNSTELYRADSVLPLHPSFCELCLIPSRIFAGGRPRPASRC